MNPLDTIRAELKATGEWYLDYPPPYADYISLGKAHQMIVLHRDKDLNVDWVVQTLMKYGMAVQPLPKNDKTSNTYTFIILIPVPEQGEPMVKRVDSPNFIKFLLSAEMVIVNKEDITPVLRAWQSKLEQDWPLPFFTPSLEIYEIIDNIKEMRQKQGWCFNQDDIIQAGRWVFIKLTYSQKPLPNRSQVVDLIESKGHKCLDPTSGITRGLTTVTEWGNYEDEIILAFSPAQPTSANQLKAELYGADPVTIDLCTSEGLESHQSVPEFLHTTSSAIKASGETLRQSVDNVGDTAGTLNEILKLINRMIPLLWVALGGLVLYFGYRIYKSVPKSSIRRTRKPYKLLSKRGVR